MKHTARIIWIIGQTEVELISSVCSRGCSCCISSFPPSSIVVGHRKGRHPPQTSPTSRLWQLPGQARPTFSLSSHAHPALDDGDDDANKRKVGAAVRSQDLQCRIFLCSGLFFPQFPPNPLRSHNATIFRRSMNVWSEALRSCVGARIPT